MKSCLQLTTDAIVKETAEDLSTTDDDLQCGQKIDETDISDIEICTTSSAIGNCKKVSFQPRDTGFASTSRYLKRNNLIPRDRTTVENKEDKETTSAEDSDGTQPLVPATETSIFTTRMRSLMMTISLLHILESLSYNVNLIVLEWLIEQYQLQENGLSSMNQEAKTILQLFLETAVTILSQNRGIQSLKTFSPIRSDPIWSTTRCGITTMNTVIRWLELSKEKTVPIPCTQTLNTINPSMSSSTTKSPALDIYTSSMTAVGTLQNVAAAGSRGTTGQTLTGDLLGHARCHVPTSQRSSRIYVQDQDGSFKYEYVLKIF